MAEDDEQELLARIGQLAGQINRHKNQQQAARTAVPEQTSGYSRHHLYRRRAPPYPSRGYRGRRQPGGHMYSNRTLDLTALRPSPADAGGSETPTTPTAGWVSKNDRHRQLINADIYQKQSQDRAKAIEESQKQKINQRRRQEKARFRQHVQHVTGTTAASPASAGPGAKNEIMVEGVKFRIADNGKKLVKILDDINSSLTTPKVAHVAGVRFYRTKSGNLVANRVVKDYRRAGVAKIDEPCKIFSSTGSCAKGPQCRYVHDPDKVALCKEFLKEGKCSQANACDLSHDMTPERVPNCLHFAKGHCAKTDCPFTHAKAPAGAPVCAAFGYCGYCEKGAECMERHVFECPDFSNTGHCKRKGCRLPHRERASMLRNRAGADEEMADLSSDDEAGDSDDVDSDAIAELLEASDDSDMESLKDFIPM